MERERERDKKERNRKRSVSPSPSSPSLPIATLVARGEKVYSNVLSYRDKDRNKDVPALRREGETHTITEVEEGARKRENGQGCSYHVSPPRPPVLEGRKSLVTLPLSLFHTQPLFPRPPRTLTDLAMAKFKLWQFLLSPLVNVKEVFPPRIPSPDASRFLFTLSRIRHGQGTDREIPVNRRGWQLVERMEIRPGPPTTPCVGNSESW